MKLSKEIKKFMRLTYNRYKAYWNGNRTVSLPHATDELQQALGGYVVVSVLEEVIWLCVKTEKDFDTVIAILYLLGYEVEE